MPRASAGMDFFAVEYAAVHAGCDVPAPAARPLQHGAPRSAATWSVVENGSREDRADGAGTVLRRVHSQEDVYRRAPGGSGHVGHADRSGFGPLGTLRKSSSQPNLVEARSNQWDEEFTFALMGLKGGSGARPRESDRAGSAPERSMPAKTVEALRSFLQPRAKRAKQKSSQVPGETTQSRRMRKNLESRGAQIATNLVSALVESEPGLPLETAGESAHQDRLDSSAREQTPSSSHRGSGPVQVASAQRRPLAGVHGQGFCASPVTSPSTALGTGDIGGCHQPPRKLAGAVPILGNENWDSGCASDRGGRESECSHPSDGSHRYKRTHIRLPRHVSRVLMESLNHYTCGPKSIDG